MGLSINDVLLEGEGGIKQLMTIDDAGWGLHTNDVKMMIFYLII